MSNLPHEGAVLNLVKNKASERGTLARDLRSVPAPIAGTRTSRNHDKNGHVEKNETGINKTTGIAIDEANETGIVIVLKDGAARAEVRIITIRMITIEMIARRIGMFALDEINDDPATRRPNGSLPHRR